MKDKVVELLSELPQIESDLSLPDVMSDKKKYRDLTAKHKYLTHLKDSWEIIQRLSRDLADAREIKKGEQDPHVIQFLEEEISSLEPKIEKLNKEVETLLVPPDPNDHKSCIVELRAGAGGDEAAIFVGDCARMYNYFAQNRGWNVEFLSSTPSDMGGFKEYQFVLSGENVYRLMKYEGGTHRVQRVPETEAQGRVHTSTITVAVMIEPDEEEDIELDEKDLRIDTYRSSGAGGQHVNTTDSAVRITHIPTGVVAHCQQERSQIKNREKAMRLLKAKIVDEQRRKRAEEIASNRSSQVGTGDRSERIRTYNFSQNRVTDHRIDLTLYNLDRMMEGDLEEMVNALVSFFYQKNFETKDG
ncbi:MAG: peptide chain release factor 1 [Chlamydiae bacterium]|jgi:peptide chain release factor 1|nr:peptide chain release factor 1 [Chlamydiota bacterium]